MSSPSIDAEAIDLPAATYTLPASAAIGHTHLNVADLGRSIGFYRDVLGFTVTYRSDGIATLAAGRYHHHVALNTWTSRGGSRPARGTTGLLHHAIVLPDRRSLAQVVNRVLDAGYELTGAFHHGVSEAYYLDDPDGIGVELYVDLPAERWPRDADGGLALCSVELEVSDLLVELVAAGSRRGRELADLFRNANAVLAVLVDSLDDRAWSIPCPSLSATVGVVAHHVAAVYPLLQAKVEAQHRGEPVRRTPPEVLAAANERHNRQFMEVTRATVLADLRAGEAGLAAAIHRLTDADLDRPIVDAGGGPVVAFQAFVQGVIIGHVAEHMADIEKALQSSGADRIEPV
jgi:catechol 2,3-dioxygenase